jgi:hypothetical protein
VKTEEQAGSCSAACSSKPPESTRALVSLANRAPGVVQVVALGDSGHHGTSLTTQVILTVRTRSLVHWREAEWILFKREKQAIKIRKEDQSKRA